MDENVSLTYTLSTVLMTSDGLVPISNDEEPG